MSDVPLSRARLRKSLGASEVPPASRSEPAREREREREQKKERDRERESEFGLKKKSPFYQAVKAPTRGYLCERIECGLCGFLI
jgi:hypothetical protein